MHADRIRVWLARVAFGGAVAMTVFQVYSSLLVGLPIHLQRGAHLGFVLLIGFLVVPYKSRGIFPGWLFSIVLCIASALSAIYLILSHDRYVERLIIIDPLTIADRVFGVITIALVLEATRKYIGWPMALIAAVLILYTFIGPFLPPPLLHPGLGFDRIVEELFVTTSGIYGTPLGIASTYIFLFILLGAVLVRTNIGGFFINIAVAFFARGRGGPAKVAVASSALFGSISGSAVANVYATGTYTIPLMKKHGYAPAVAGAVEACASTGGQILPPIMGAAAFIVADFVGIPYGQVALAALIPALLYFFCIWLAVDAYAAQTGLADAESTSLLAAWALLARNAHTFIPIVAIIYLIFAGYSMTFSAVGGIVAALAISFASAGTRLNWRGFLAICDDAPMQSLSISIACACAGIIISMMLVSGLGLQVVSWIVTASFDIPFLALFFTMVATIILGMGMPTSGAYMVVAALAAPALIKLGFSALAAHMFVFYFACFSAITPPVALASYAGASVAGADMSETGWIAFRIGIIAFVIPYMFAFGPALLLQGSPAEIALAAVSASAGVIAISAGVTGWFRQRLNGMERIIAAAGGLMLVKPGTGSDFAGLAVLLLLLAHYYWKRARRLLENGS